MRRLTDSEIAIVTSMASDGSNTILTIQKRLKIRRESLIKQMKSLGVENPQSQRMKKKIAVVKEFIQQGKNTMEISTLLRSSPNVVRVLKSRYKIKADKGE